MSTPPNNRQQAPIFISPGVISNYKGKQFYIQGPPGLSHYGLGLPFPTQAQVPASFCFPPPHGMPTPPIGEFSPPMRGARYDEDRHSSSGSHTLTHLNLGGLLSPETTVEILVIENGICQAFPVHSELLASYSPYFRASLAEGREEARQTAAVESHMLRREWRWENAGDVATMDVDSGAKVEVEVVVK